jgi:sodium transport system ATP-binding protein
MVEVTNLRKSYERRRRRVEALKGISFVVSPGSIFGLIGPNGAGKTTTLRTIATLLRPDEGKVTVNGHDTVREAREVRNAIGFLTSDMKLSGQLSPRELLRFFGDLNHLEPKRTAVRIDALAAELDMGQFLDRPVAKLSTGMKQKAAIAVSIVHDPDVIVFDEPTAGLDIVASKIVVDFLKDSRSKGKTVILSTHVIQEAERLCDTLGILVAGQLLAQGSRGEILSRHQAGSVEEVFFSLFREERQGGVA